jgi:putative ABC transport system permease protein
MIKNYFKIALRGFRRHKLFTLINVVGLSIGISAALVIYLIVHFDFTFDQFHKDSERIYRVTTDYSYSGEVGHNNGVTMALPASAREEATGLDQVAPFFIYGETTVLIPNGAKADNKIRNQVGIILADEHYFNIINYKWIAGNAKTSLKDPNQVVLTSKQASIYFPKLSYSDMIGKEVIYDDSVKTTVSGIVAPLEEKSDFIFHDFISYISGTTDKHLTDYFQLTEWGSTNSASQMFIKLSANASAANVEKQLNVLLKKHHPPKPEDAGNTQGFHLQPLNAIHFDQVYGGMDGIRTANKTTLYGLLVIAGFLLILGCINFINLTTAQASQRAKEIGIRKTMGSRRSQLIMQFLSETFLVTLFAVIISVGLAPVILKLFKDFIPEGITLNLLGQPSLIVFLVLLTVLVSALSGFYPAMVLSGYKPITVLKNQQINSNKSRNAWLRKSLTVTQFVIAQFFIMATLVVSKQIYYALHKNLGFKKDAIVNISTPWKSARTNKQEVFLNKIRSVPQIALMSVGGAPPSSFNTNSTEVTYKDGKKEIKTDVQQKFADENYIKLYQIKIIAGRALRTADSTGGGGTVINNTYAKVLGFRNANDAIGKILDYNGKKKEIVGVAGDFYQKSLHSPIKPLAILPATTKGNNRTFHLALKAQTAGGTEWKTAIASFEKIWKEVYPEDDFEYTFYDENIAKFYTAEQHTSTLLTWATGLSIFISCLGLLGLAIYTTGQRTKEIGVRKVLGASVSQIVTLLSTELVLLIVLAFVIVTPVAYYAMHKWMEDFSDRTTISWWIFALSGMGMLAAALFTLSFQTVKAAVANPVRSLRSE